MTKTAVVLLNWNGKSWLQKFLLAVVEHTSGADIYVADNASTDDSISYLQRPFSPAAGIIRNTSNAGFAGGYNLALQNLDHEFFLLLNTDIEVTPGWLQPLTALMEQDKMIAACQPKIRSYAERNKFEHAGAAGGFIDSYGYPFCRGRLFTVLEDDNGQYDSATDIFWATGACMLLRAELYRSVGGLDEEFFAHMEEIDLCWRLKSRGYRIACQPASIVYHVGGGTLPKNNPRKTYLNFRNNLMMIFKNLPSKRLVKVFTVRLLLDVVAALKFLGEGDVSDAVAVVKAYFYFITTFNKRLRSRRNAKHGVSLQPLTQVYSRSIVWDFYIRKRKTWSQLLSNRFT